MKLQEYYTLLKENESKIPVIDQITLRHPGYGIDLGWSWYVGGMTDNGAWNIEKLLTIPLYTLQRQEEIWQQKDQEAKKQQEIYSKLSTAEKMQIEKQNWDNFQNEQMRRLMWGK